MIGTGLNFEDYKIIMAHKGKVRGEVSNCDINDLTDCIDRSIMDSISEAKGILINFKIHKDQTFFALNDLIVKIHEFANDNAEIIFTTEQLDYIEKDNINYEIIITGL